MKQVSVIILNWNGAQHGFLQQYLPSVVEHTDAELADVVVADNGSTDNSLELLAEQFPTVKVLALGRNYGFAEGYNRAIKQVETPLVLLLNDDVRVTPHWLEPMVEHMNQHRHTMAIQPKILSDSNPKMFEYAGACGGFLDKNGYPFCRGRIFDTVEEDHGQYDSVCSIMWASGACLLTRRDEYLKVGGLDKHFFAHMEEIDYCWRLRRRGYRIICLPQSVVYHLGGGSLPAENPHKTMLNFRNSLLMLYKNLPRKRRKGFIFHRKCLDGLAAINFLLHGKLGHVRAILTAHKQYRMMVEDIYEQEEFMFRGNGLYGHAHHFEEEYINILIAYHLFRRKKFSDL